MRAHTETPDVMFLSPAYLIKVIGMVKDRCHLLTDFISQSSFFFEMPATVDIAAVKPKWDDKKNMFFTANNGKMTRISYLELRL